jgi:hypothetical protein
VRVRACDRRGRRTIAPPLLPLKRLARRQAAAADNCAPLLKEVDAVSGGLELDRGRGSSA